MYEYTDLDVRQQMMKNKKQVCTHVIRQSVKKAYVRKSLRNRTCRGKLPDKSDTSYQLFGELKYIADDLSKLCTLTRYQNRIGF